MTLTNDQIYKLRKKIWDIKHIDALKLHINDLMDSLLENQTKLIQAEKVKHLLPQYEYLLSQETKSNASPSA